MTAPRLRIHLDKIRHNACTLVDRLAGRGISVTGVTKATLGSPEIARAMLQANVSGLGDSRIENIESMRGAQISARMSMIRSPMLSQAQRVVVSASLSFNSQMETVRRLSVEARRLDRIHEVVLMVELGDLREGIMPADLTQTVREILGLRNIAFKGLGTNLACRSGVSPDDTNMAELSRLAELMESTFGISLEVVSGGNSANLEWVFSSEYVGRINNLRLGESILLGREALHRRPIPGLYTDAITLVAEVIESRYKPQQSTGQIAENAFGVRPVGGKRGTIPQTILAIGIQDVDPVGLRPPAGVKVLGGSSDYLIVTAAGHRMAVGTEISFQLDYSALLRAMTSPFVARAHHYASISPTLGKIA